MWSHEEQVVDSPVHEELESSSDVNEPEAVPSETEESDISELEPIVGAPYALRRIADMVTSRLSTIPKFEN